MIELSNDYIPYTSTCTFVCDAYGKLHPIRCPSVVISGVDLPSYSKTKKNRFISLLGRGDIQKGEVIFLKYAEEFSKEFMDMCDVLSSTPRGFKTLGKYLGKTDAFVRGVKYELIKYGIVSYLKFLKVHSILKAYRSLVLLKDTPCDYLPISLRLPLDEKFIKKYFWVKQLTKNEIAHELIVPINWVDKEIRRLKMTKKGNNIKRKGRKGWKAPEEYGLARRKQPHARAVVQLCPRSFKILRRYDSIKSVERDGWSAGNVRKSINTAGLHDCFLWAHSDDIEGLILRVKAQSNFIKKLEILEKGAVSHDAIKELYINQGMTAVEVGSRLNCHPTTVVLVSNRIGLKKRQPVSTKILRKLYLDEHLTPEEIGVRTGHSKSTIQTYLSKRGIRKNKKLSV